jgi:hypothetical protein
MREYSQEIYKRSIESLALYSHRIRPSPFHPTLQQLTFNILHFQPSSKPPTHSAMDTISGQSAPGTSLGQNTPAGLQHDVPRTVRTIPSTNVKSEACSPVLTLRLDWRARDHRKGIWQTVPCHWGRKWFQGRLQGPAWYPEDCP